MAETQTGLGDCTRYKHVRLPPAIALEFVCRTCGQADALAHSLSSDRAPPVVRTRLPSAKLLASGKQLPSSPCSLRAGCIQCERACTVVIARELAVRQALCAEQEIYADIKNGLCTRRHWWSPQRLLTGHSLCRNPPWVARTVTARRQRLGLSISHSPSSGDKPAG